MPDHEEHCKHTLARYGVRGDDIHSYMDEPCKVAGKGHRVYRHDTKTIKLVGEIFADKYGREVAENIALDHITADHEEEIKRRSQGPMLLKCPNCGGQLETGEGVRKCAHCGFSSEVNTQTDYTIESVKLPSKNQIVFLYRESNDDSLPITLPPLWINGYHQYGSREKTIDDVYEKFEDKAIVELVLEHVLDYYPVTVSELRLDKYGNMSDRQIKELLIQSKSITSQKIQDILNQPKIKQIQTDYKRHLADKAIRDKSIKPIKTLALPTILAIGAVWLFYRYAEPIYLLFWAAVGFFSGLFLNFLWAKTSVPQTIMANGSERINYIKMLKRSQDTRAISTDGETTNVLSKLPLGSANTLWSKFWLVLIGWIIAASILGYILGYVYPVGNGIMTSAIFVSSIPVFAWVLIRMRFSKRQKRTETQ